MNWLRRIMYGRYGYDQLSLALLVLYLVLYLLGGLFRWGLLSVLSLVPAVLVIFRVFSRDIPRRRAENAKFLSLTSPLTRWVRLHRTARKDKEHCYFKCPNCGQYLRVPRGKGKIHVTCRNCGVSFDEKT